MDRNELERRVAGFAWYHAIDLGQGVVTPGPCDPRPYLPHYGLPESLRGLDVLDVGTASGFFAFEFERRGARRVVATDLSSWEDHDFLPARRDALRALSADDRADIDRRTLRGQFELCREALGSRVEKIETRIYDLDPAKHGSFDLVFCASVLMHLRDPAAACAALRRVTRGACVVATSTETSFGDAPVARFVGEADGTNWWRLSPPALEAMLRVAGFARVEPVSTFTLRSRDGGFEDPHCVARAYPA